MMAGVLAGVIVIIPLEFKRAEQTLDLDRFPALAFFARLGLVMRINPVRGALEKASDDGGGRLEESSADKHFQFLHRRPGRRLRGEARHYLRDLPFLGEKAGRTFFLESRGTGSGEYGQRSTR